MGGIDDARFPNFADLAEMSYKIKLRAAEEIGASRVRMIDPDFDTAGEKVDLKPFDLPLYRSPAPGEACRRPASRTACRKSRSAPTLPHPAHLDADSQRHRSHGSKRPRCFAATRTRWEEDARMNRLARFRF